LPATLDLSAYQQISFWFLASLATTAGQYSLRLCSDSAGVTAVATVPIPAQISASTPMQVVYDAGSALSSNVNSIALYRESGTGVPSLDVMFVMASKAPGSADALTLASMVGHVDSHGAGGTDTDTWYPIAFIDGTMLVVDSEVGATTANGKGYSGSTKTGVALYRRECFRMPAPFNAGIIQPAGGSAALPCLLTTGWNRTDMSTQTGETWFDGTNGTGTGLNLPNATATWVVDSFATPRMSFVRCGVGASAAQVVATQISLVSILSCTTAWSMGHIGHLPNRVDFIHNNNIFMGTAGNKVTPLYCKSICNNSFSLVSYPNNAWDGKIIGNGTGGRGIFRNNPGISARTGIARFVNIDFTAVTNLFSGDAANGVMTSWFLYNCTMDTTPILAAQTPFSMDAAQNFVYSWDHNSVAGSNKMWSIGLTMETDTVTVDAGSTKSWKFTMGNIPVTQPYRIPVANIQGKSGVSTTVTLRVNRTNSNVACRLFVRGGQPGYISATDITSSLASASTGTWETLSLTFTPDNTTMVEICVEFYLTSGSSGVFYIDNLTTSAIASGSDLNGFEVGMLGESANSLLSESSGATGGSFTFGG
jgi:hypothetical protein